MERNEEKARERERASLLVIEDRGSTIGKFFGTVKTKAFSVHDEP